MLSRQPWPESGAAPPWSRPRWKHASSTAPGGTDRPCSAAETLDADGNLANERSRHEVRRPMVVLLDWTRQLARPRAAR